MAVELKVALKQLTASASEGTARDHKVTIDRPESMGGSNMGFSGGELFLVGLGGCFMSNLLAAIKARESAIQDVSVDILARADGSPTKIQEITLDVRASYTDRSEIEKLVLIAERGCVVANSIKDAIKLTIRVV